jgi:hypothetical protein
MAEREGFEPPLEFPLNTLSKRAPSATRPSLRGVGKILRDECLDSMGTEGGPQLGVFTSCF